MKFNRTDILYKENGKKNTYKWIEKYLSIINIYQLVNSTLICS